ncbi:MAG: PAS domain S-box protein [Pirellulales bacterium]
MSIDKKSAEPGLRDSVCVDSELARLAAIVECSEDAIISKALDGRILSWNEAAHRLYGYSANEAIGKSISMIVPADRVDEENEILARVASGERVQHYQTVRVASDGRQLNISLSVSPIRNPLGEIVAASSIARDITAQKEIEKRLQDREALLRTATDNAAVGLVMLDSERRYIFANAAYLRILHLPWTVDQLIGKSPAEVLPEVYPSQIAPRLDRAFAGDRVTYEFTLPTSGECNRVSHFVVIYDPIINRLGVVDNVIVTIFDITEREQVEAALRDSEDRLAFALESHHIGAWDVDLIENTAFRTLEHGRIFGYSPPLPEWNFDTFLTHVLKEDHQRVKATIEEGFSSKKDWNFECRIHRADGQVRWIWVAGRPHFSSTGIPSRIVGVVQDITERKKSEDERQKLESQIQHAQKLESLGVLAGGIAHDFNNILTSILGYTDLALLELPNHSSARPLINEAVNGARRAADLTKQMLAYSEKGVSSLNH